jgi:hypothetical protein
MGLWRKPSTVVAALINPLSGTFFDVVDNSLITEDLISNPLIPGMQWEPLNTKLYMERNNSSFPQCINISSLKTQLNKPINESTHNENNIPCPTLRKDNNERIRLAAIGVELMLTDTKVVRDAVLQLIAGAEPNQPLLLHHHRIVGEHDSSFLHIWVSRCHLERNSRMKPWITQEVYHTSPAISYRLS